MFDLLFLFIRSESLHEGSYISLNSSNSVIGFKKISIWYKPDKPLLS